MKKRAQLTLFIILSAILVFAIFLLFFYWKPEIFLQGTNRPRLESCLESSLTQKINLLALSGGLINSKFNYPYMGENYSYLCYTHEYYKPCVNQVPLLTKTFEDSLKELIQEEFQECYDASVGDLRARGYEVIQGPASFNISIEPEEVVIEIMAPTTITDGSTSTSYSKYTSRQKTNLYEILMVATSIIQFETAYGDSEQLAQMYYYPNLLIEKTRRDDDTKVYSITEKDEKIKFNFAVKSYPWPAGTLL